MLVLFETPAGYALFKVLDEGILKKPDNIWESFETPAKASKAYVRIFKLLVLFVCAILVVSLGLLQVRMCKFFLLKWRILFIIPGFASVMWSSSTDFILPGLSAL